MSSLAHLPGGRLVAEGIKDWESGFVTPAACLVALGWPRLHRAGIVLKTMAPHHIQDPHRQLYQLLVQEGRDAYSRYNSLIRQLISFEQSLEQENARLGKPKATA